MNPGFQRLAWLAGVAACVGALALAVIHWRGDGDAAPQQAAVPAPLPSVVPAPAVPVDEASAATAAASVPAVAMPESAVLRHPLADVSRMQRDIQLALSSDQRGKAGEAARHIEGCMAWERNPERTRQHIEKLVRALPESAAAAIRAGHQAMVASCQAVDAASRAQLVPLLRRSLAEGDKGAAASLVQALGKDFKLADEPAVVAALRRDAWDCDRSSQRALGALARQNPQLLTPNEIGALREQMYLSERSGVERQIRRAEGDPKRKAALEQMYAVTYQPPPGADPAEVARISADIQSRCKAEPS